MSFIKKCSKCFVEKDVCCFISRDRCICKSCANIIASEKRKNAVIDPNNLKTCIICNNTKSVSLFMYYSALCKDCHNEKRRNNYAQNEKERTRIKEEVRIYKHKKTKERQQKREEEQKLLDELIGADNMICNKCTNVKPKTKYRKNRRICKDCDRDDEYLSFTRLIRSRIHGCIKDINETDNIDHIRYLGCSYKDYIKWISNVNPQYNMNNHGEIWHIDHVIPISTFNLENIDEREFAFNWRNTTSLSAKENLSKNNKIIKEQIKEHINKLIDYHTINNIDLPNKYLVLFAKHLDAGIP
jgi:hypothetical protein